MINPAMRRLADTPIPAPRIGVPLTSPQAA
jgi:hypothetical protein